jgi:hypothetical protein
MAQLLSGSVLPALQPDQAGRWEGGRMKYEAFYRFRRPAKEAVRALLRMGAEHLTVTVDDTGLISVVLQDRAGEWVDRATTAFYRSEPDPPAFRWPGVERYIGVGVARFREGGNQTTAKGAEHAAAR